MVRGAWRMARGVQRVTYGIIPPHPTSPHLTPTHPTLPHSTPLDPTRPHWTPLDHASRASQVTSNGGRRRSISWRSGSSMVRHPLTHPPAHAPTEVSNAPTTAIVHPPRIHPFPPSSTPYPPSSTLFHSQRPSLRSVVWFSWCCCSSSTCRAPLVLLAGHAARRRARCTMTLARGYARGTHGTARGAGPWRALRQWPVLNEVRFDSALRVVRGVLFPSV